MVHASNSLIWHLLMYSMCCMAGNFRVVPLILQQINVYTATLASGWISSRGRGGTTSSGCLANSVAMIAVIHDFDYNNIIVYLIINYFYHQTIIPRAYRAAEGGERACNVVYGKIQNASKNSRNRNPEGGVVT